MTSEEVDKCLALAEAKADLAAAVERGRIVALIRAAVATSKVGPGHMLSWEIACLTIARIVEESRAAAPGGG